MAEVKNATLKRFNGTDYDTIHPQTDWTQIESKPLTFTPTAHTLNSHSDVNASAPEDGFVLSWNAEASKWIAAQAAGGSSFLDGGTATSVYTDAEGWSGGGGDGGSRRVAHGHRVRGCVRWMRRRAAQLRESRLRRLRHQPPAADKVLVSRVH